MSTGAVQSQSSIQDLALNILTQYDTNKDGQLNGTEFSNVLSALLGTTASSGTAPATSSAPASSTGSTGSTGSSSSALGALPASEMTGFNFDKIMDPTHNTPKYIFARVAWNTDLSSVHDSASAQACLEGMVPQLQAAGLNVTSVDSDKITYSDGSGSHTIDVIRDKGGPNMAFQWLDQASVNATASSSPSTSSPSTEAAANSFAPSAASAAAMRTASANRVSTQGAAASSEVASRHRVAEHASHRPSVQGHRSGTRARS